MNKFKEGCGIAFICLILCLIFGASLDVFEGYFLFGDEFTFLPALLIFYTAYKILFNKYRDTKAYVVGSIIIKAFLVLFTFVFGLGFATEYLFRDANFISLLFGLGMSYLAYIILFPKSMRLANFTFHKPIKQDHDLPPLSRKRQKIYQESGLTDEEIIFFRQELAKAKKQLIDIEASFWRNNKLTAIARRHNMVAILRDYFKELADNPNRLNEGTNFLYSYIPSLHDLIDKYLEINNHVSKTQLTYRTLDKTAETIDDLCQTIEDDYLAFQKDDFKDAEIEIELARQKMQQATTTEDTTLNVEGTNDDDFENSFDNF